MESWKYAMKLPTVVNTFSPQPWLSLLLALLVMLMAFLFLSGWIPSARKYFPGHEWVMAAICAGLALFFVVCAVIGFRERRNRPSP